MNGVKLAEIMWKVENISHLWNTTSFSFLTGQVSHPCNILLLTQPLYSLPFIVNDISLLVSSDTNCLKFSGSNCLNLFYPIRIPASTAAPASPSNSICHLNSMKHVWDESRWVCHFAYWNPLTVCLAYWYTHTHTHTQPFYCSSGIFSGSPGWAGTRKVNQEG